MRGGLRTIPFSDVHPFGATFFLEREVEPWKRRQTVQMAADAGLRWAYQHFPWSDIEPLPGQFSWAKYDDIVTLYRRHGLEVIARLDWPPSWVEPAPWVLEAARGVVNAPPASADIFARYVAATVRHFRGRVRFYQIWYEPNLVAEWGANPAHPANPEEYVALLRAAAEAARRVDPDAVILSAPLAPNNEVPDLRGNVGDLDYLDGMYRAGAAADFDILSANSFGMDRPPTEAPDPEVLNFRRAELQREVMVRHDDADTAVWFTQLGWNAAPETLDSPWGRVSDSDQARYSVDAVALAERQWSWAGAFCLWYFRQWGQKTPNDPDYYFRMVDVDFSPRPLYDAVRTAARVQVARPGVWAERSAPVTLAELDDWRWHWAADAEGRNALTAHRAGASLWVAVQGEGLAARVWAAADAGAVRVTVDEEVTDDEVGVVLPLPRDPPGWQWLDLTGPLSRGNHQVRITAVGEGQVTLDAFEVPRQQRWSQLDGSLLLLLLLAGGLVVMLAVDARSVAGRIRL